MKKLTLNAKAFAKGEVLTKAQLKKVTGGYGGGSSTDPFIDRVAACVGKTIGDPCSWLVDREPIYGICDLRLWDKIYCAQ